MNNKKYKDVFYHMREIRSLRDLIDSSADLFTDRTAYLIKERPGGEYSPVAYRQVKAEMDALGTKFIDMGLAGKKIAVIGENSYPWILAYIATVCSGGVIVPIDRELHPKEIANLLNRSGASAIVYSKKMDRVIADVLEQDELTAQLEHFVCMSKENGSEDGSSLPELIESGEKLLAAGDRRFLDVQIDENALCAILFTSGTTGLAKGVMLSHKNIAANVYNMSKYVKIVENGIGLSVLPMHHSYEMTCHIFTAFYQGLSVAICEGLKYIQKNMAEARATVMLGVPLVFESMHKKIFKQAEAKGKLEKMQKMMALSKKLKLYNNQKLIRRIFREIHEMTGNNVHLFIVGGAAVNPKVVEDFEALGFPMIQGYGMTENAPIIAVNRDNYSKAASAGPPMPGTEVRIMDPDETGMGEIVCRGPSVMLGYYDDPEETAKVLHDGWLSTGDYGYFDEDGFLYISGRKKNVIVTKNGKNIFPEEVEFYLLENDCIEEVLVHGILDEKSGDIVVRAEIYPNYELIDSRHGRLSEQQLWDLLKGIIDEINEQMPLYKRVKRFGIRRTEFDKTTTRKIKRYTEENLKEN